MVHIVIGTKAQFIKMYPVIKQLEERNIEFNFINLGQHSDTIRSLCREFGFSPSLQRSFSPGSDISSLAGGIVWMGKMAAKSFNKSWLRRHIFRGKKGICLIHGDTASTLLGLLMGKLAGIRVVHIEAGLRSYNMWEPFPEEIVRLLAMKFADLLFAPSLWAYDNLCRMGYKRKAVLFSGNTSFDVFKLDLNDAVLPEGISSPFALVSIHRMENIFSRRRLRIVVEVVKMAEKRFKVVFVQHPPTARALCRFNMQEELEVLPNLTMFSLLAHRDFLGLLRHCELVITDGGSVQEEAYYLGRPCLLMRKATERTEGIGENVFISYMDSKRVEEFLKTYRSFERGMIKGASPAQEIVDFLIRERLVNG
ncbi:MAG: UDP-N-acetylglucosamine 2-epimerase [Candidatus Omnitrophica bacterium]|nr:UDP-N-acetylglucosamine 2-epimerase [Candidatus Omnitrophota bacterium]